MYYDKIMEKNIKKNVYICIIESLFCTAEFNIVNQIYFNKNVLKIQKISHSYFLEKPLHCPLWK